MYLKSKGITTYEMIILRRNKKLGRSNSHNLPNLKANKSSIIINKDNKVLPKVSFWFIKEKRQKFSYSSYGKFKKEFIDDNFRTKKHAKIAISIRKDFEPGSPKSPNRDEEVKFNKVERSKKDLIPRYPSRLSV